MKVARHHVHSSQGKSLAPASYNSPRQLLYAFEEHLLYETSLFILNLLRFRQMKI